MRGSIPGVVDGDVRVDPVVDAVDVGGGALAGAEMRATPVGMVWAVSTSGPAMRWSGTISATRGSAARRRAWAGLTDAGVGADGAAERALDAGADAARPRGRGRRVGARPEDHDHALGGGGRLGREHARGGREQREGHDGCDEQTRCRVRNRAGTPVRGRAPIRSIPRRADPNRAPRGARSQRVRWSHRGWDRGRAGPGLRSGCPDRPRIASAGAGEPRPASAHEERRVLAGEPARGDDRPAAREDQECGAQHRRRPGPQRPRSRPMSGG